MISAVSVRLRLGCLSIAYVCLMATEGELRSMKVVSHWPMFVLLSSYCYSQLHTMSHHAAAMHMISYGYTKYWKIRGLLGGVWGIPPKMCLRHYCDQFCSIFQSVSLSIYRVTCGSVGRVLDPRVVGSIPTDAYCFMWDNILGQDVNLDCASLHPGEIWVLSYKGYWLLCLA